MFAIIVHGGAGIWPADRIPRAIDGANHALDVAVSILTRKGSALDAVEQAVRVLEDDPVFNAGTGSHANTDGEIEMDAILVDGTSGRFGSVAAIRNVRHPVSVARRIMEDTTHCLLAGEGASRFAHEHGFEYVPNETLLGDALFPDGDTVGAVAVDMFGTIAAATSTGGTRGKMPGRVGDAPIFGAGAFADARCGVSATGVGEYIMRALTSKSLADAIARGVTPELAAQGAVAQLEHAGGVGGVIALDLQGRVGFQRNTPAMPVAFVDGTGHRYAGA